MKRPRCLSRRLTLLSKSPRSNFHTSRSNHTFLSNHNPLSIHTFLHLHPHRTNTFARHHRHHHTHPDIPIMALPPCHMFCQFYVTLPTRAGEKPKLSCLMYQRSADLGLGIPFNIASYALLTHMVAKVTDTEAHELIMQLGDAHVYRDHVEALQQQLTREPREFPRLRWARQDFKDIDDFKFDDFIVDGYKPHPKLEMKMSV